MAIQTLIGRELVPLLSHHHRILLGGTGLEQAYYFAWNSE